MNGVHLFKETMFLVHRYFNLKEDPAPSFAEATKMLNTPYSVFKRARSKRGNEFVLTKEEYEDKIAKPCYYCGRPPELGGMSVDRLDSSLKLYSKDTVVGCCQVCNYAKNTEGEKEFVARAKRVFEEADRIKG